MLAAATVRTPVHLHCLGVAILLFAFRPDIAKFPSITADGIYGNRTKEAVAKFQSVFGLPATGVVDYPTWYRISDIYVAVSRIAELR